MISQFDQKITSENIGPDADSFWMGKAIRLAKRAEKLGEIPVGAVLVGEGTLLSVGHNLSITHNDPSAHAEMIAIRRAGQKLRNYRLVNTTLYVTLEPCPMCAGLLVHSRVGRIVFGAFDSKTGAAGTVMNICHNSQLNHQIDITSGVLEKACSELLSNFFKRRRAEKKALKKHSG
ncbi:tRNA adenosine(34) deaminase TadA [Alteromonas sediminis]|uniref:tRNA-specific adenosine deaminase n=1 Tax=Alteromonas sediminis TaxID=2259342 RepID=A0A3N5XX45_9ALTE|nr:tRNA adenosine(34) deaminase TadA [Alteromonas sediminis]RPJ64933.1 tRNA adenosine(34) deaminase TadA [Alteromonas sediminis]